jgi:hypothetical protein
VNPLRAFRAPAVAIVLLAAASCGPAGPKLHPVKGKVLYEGNPAAGASVVFEPVDGSGDTAKPSGLVGPDGSFTLTTYPHGDGAPAGEYVVLVTWYPENARELDHPKNKLPARYADPMRTTVPKVTVQAGPNDLAPFALTAK